MPGLGTPARTRSPPSLPSGILCIPQPARPAAASKTPSSLLAPFGPSRLKSISPAASLHVALEGAALNNRTFTIPSRLPIDWAVALIADYWKSVDGRHFFDGLGDFSAIRDGLTNTISRWPRWWPSPALRLELASSQRC